MRRTQLPILEPCSADWSAMRGDARRRFCEACALPVLHLSAMTADEARAALAGPREGRLCVRYACDADGRLVFAAPVARAAVLASALTACTGVPSGLPETRRPGLELEDRCELADAGVDATDGPLACDAPEPPPRDEPVLETVEGGVVFGVDVKVTMGVVATIAVAPPPLPEVASIGPTAPSDSLPGRSLPVECLMGTVAPPPLVVERDAGTHRNCGD